ncbi:hypothetical protein [Actinophytocola sediminis]
MDLVPVGHDLGVVHDGAGGRARQVRVGAELAELSESQYVAWSSAHADQLRRDDPMTGALLDRRLLAEVSDPVAFASGHRLLPLALGLGNAVDEPWLFSVGLLYQPMLAMTGPLYDLWQWAHLSPDLWSACQEAAAVAARAGVDEPTQTDPAEVLAGALATAPELLAARVACFDVRIGGPA